MATESVASGVVQPNVEALVCQVKCHRVRSITTDSCACIQKPMLVEHNRSVWLILWLCMFGSAYSKDAIYIVVFSCVEVLLNWIVVVCHHLHERLVLVVFGCDIFVHYAGCFGCVLVSFLSLFFDFFPLFCEH